MVDLLPKILEETRNYASATLYPRDTKDIIESCSNISMCKVNTS